MSGILDLRGSRIKRKLVLPYKLQTDTIHVSRGMNNFLGQENVTILPQASMRAEGRRGEKTNRMWVVEKPAGEEPSEHRILGMGCSTLRQPWGRESPACHKNGHYSGSAFATSEPIAR